MHDPKPQESQDTLATAEDVVSSATVAQPPPEATQQNAYPTHEATRPGSDPQRTTAVESDLDATAAGDAASLEQKIMRMKAATERARVKHDPMIGLEIQGRFRITGKIGEGGMGTVYRGEQISIKRPIAIKTLLRQLVKDEKFVRRFQNEALAVSKLGHPNTIRIIDFGQIDEGVFYIVMELLIGRPLQRALREDGAMGVRRVLHILEQAARSLHEAHGKGIVHRDLKPDNIFLCKVDDDPDFVKVLDFGVAKMIDDESGTRESLTQTAMILGTPKYMSPEQGMTRQLDGRSDLYALGVMAYEALIGVAPFTGEPMALLYHHVHTQPKSPGEVRPDIEIPVEVEKLVMRLLAKDPALRPANGDDLANECQRLREALPPAYEKLVTRDEAAQQAVLEERKANTVVTSAHRADTLAHGGPSTEATTGIDALLTPVAAPRSRWLGWAIAAASVLVVLAGAAVAFKLSVDTLPPAYRLSIAPGLLPTQELGVLPIETVQVRLASDPKGAEVLQGGTSLGKAPLLVERLRDEPPVTYAFRFDKGAVVTLDVPFRADGTYTAELPKEPPVAEVPKDKPTDATTDKPPTEVAGPETNEKKPGQVVGKKKPPRTPKDETGTTVSSPPKDTGQVNILK